MPMLFFEKQNMFKRISISLLKNICKDLSDPKIVVTRDLSSLNYGPLNLLFRFTDSP